MSILLILNTLTKLWSNILINGRGKWCQLENWQKKLCSESWQIWNKKTYQRWYLHYHCPDCSSLYRYISHHFGLLKYSACSDDTHFLEHYMESKLLQVLGIHQPCSQATHFFLSQHNTYLEDGHLEKLRWKTVYVSKK